MRVLARHKRAGRAVPAPAALAVANFIVSYFFLQEIGLVGKPATFWIYAFVGMVATGFIWLRVPETKGRSLEQIEQQAHGRPEQAA